MEHGPATPRTLPTLGTVGLQLLSALAEAEVFAVAFDSDGTTCFAVDGRGFVARVSAWDAQAALGAVGAAESNARLIPYREVPERLRS